MDVLVASAADSTEASPPDRNASAAPEQRRGRALRDGSVHPPVPEPVTQAAEVPREAAKLAVGAPLLAPACSSHQGTTSPAVRPQQHDDRHGAGGAGGEDGGSAGAADDLHRNEDIGPVQPVDDLADPQGPSPAAPDSGTDSPAAAAADAVREVLVDWMAAVGEAMLLDPAALRAAVELLDGFTARQFARPPDALMQLVALTCLAVAARQDELQPSQLTLQQWARLAVDPISGAPLYEEYDLRRMEWILTETMRGAAAAAAPAAAASIQPEPNATAPEDCQPYTPPSC